MRILLCENRALAATDTARKLRDLGHTLCGTATSASECLELVFLTRPDLVLVGLGEDGAEADLMEALIRLGIPALVAPGEAHGTPAAPSTGTNLLADLLTGIEGDRAPPATDSLTEALASHRPPTRTVRRR